MEGGPTKEAGIRCNAQDAKKSPSGPREEDRGILCKGGKGRVAGEVVEADGESVCKETGDEVEPWGRDGLTAILEEQATPASAPSVRRRPILQPENTIKCTSTLPRVHNRWNELLHNA
ncbi:hypothetical protein Nepgr_016405 [Nepenthes gracilis]|uniref:Uncharacterized protein n=1 Tax=Nepenthes gracilis TaxID=150966 RepID=A0AAD3XS21_NEPGR|nr:hypothetical protein Nepgr_016405 [Nepenthes gracilis]